MREEPSRPLFGDQRKWGLQLTTRVKALILAIVLGLMGLAALALYLLSYLADARDQRQQDQRQLACLLVLHYPPNSTIELVREIRAKYRGCPYQPLHGPPQSSTTPTGVAPPPSSGRNRPRAAPSATPSAQQLPGGVSTPAGTAQGSSGPRPAPPVRTRTVIRAQPGPTVTVRPSPTPGPPVPLPPVVCRLPVVGGPLCGLLG